MLNELPSLMLLPTFDPDDLTKYLSWIGGVSL